MAYRLLPWVDEQSGLLNVADSESEVGWLGLELFLTASEGRDVPVRWQTMEQVAEGKYLAVTPPDAPVAAKLVTERSPSGAGWLLTPTLQGYSELKVRGYGFRPARGQRGPWLGKNLQSTTVFAHTDNLRYEEMPYCRATFPFVQPIPPQPRELNRQPSGPVPLLALGTQGDERWLLEAAFSQHRHQISWRLGLPPDTSRIVDCRSQYWWHGPAEAVEGPLELETTLLALFEGPIDAALSWYGQELSRRYEFPIRRSRMMDTPVFCTWNYGIWFNVTEADCLRRMDVVKEVQPGSYFQIDHGYEPRLYGDTASTGMIDPYYPDGSNAWDLQTFPSGPHGFVRACRDRGLRPGIWWTPRVHPKGAILREHPDWLVTGSDGKIIDVGYLLLDYSVPAVRRFLENSIDTVVNKWGFEGIKLDFFTWMFDHPDARFRFGGTALEHKSHFTQMIREILGPEGYLLHCCTCPMGTPLTALSGLDSWRAGLDIDKGDWQMHVQSCIWMLPGALVSPPVWLTNIDSCMGHPDVPEIERRSRLALAYLTSGMLEFSGPAEQFDKRMLSDWRRMVQRYDPGEPFECPDPQAFYGVPFPRVLLRRHRADGRTRREHGVVATVGLLNWTDQALATGISLAELKLPAGENFRVRDFWTGQELALRDESFVHLLPPRGSRLLDICCV